MTRYLYNFSLLVKLMVLLRQILFNLAIAETTMMEIFADQVHRVAP